MKDDSTSRNYSEATRGAAFGHSASRFSRPGVVQSPQSSKRIPASVVVTFTWLLILHCMPDRLNAAELKPETVRAFDQYVQRAERRITGSLTPGSSFLWVDGLPSADRAAAYARLRSGGIFVHSFAAGLNVPGGMIHDWLGVAFFPGTTLDETVAQTQNYDAYAQIYSPEVVRAKILKRDDAHFTVSLWLQDKSFVTTVFDVHENIRYFPLSPSREYSRAHAIQIDEVDDPGSSSELANPSKVGHGYLWKLNDYSWFEQTPEGVYMQIEVIALSRNIPWGLGWLLRPFVIKVPRNSLTFTLARTRASVKAAEDARPSTSSTSKECQHSDIGQCTVIDRHRIRSWQRGSRRPSICLISGSHLPLSTRISTTEIGRMLAVYLVNL